MVYIVDPRAGYGLYEINLTWYLEYLRERNQTLKNLGETDEEIKTNEIGLYNEIDTLVNRWVTYKVFDYKHPALDELPMRLDCMDIYFVIDWVVRKFIGKNSDMWKLCDIDEE